MFFTLDNQVTMFFILSNQVTMFFRLWRVQLGYLQAIAWSSRGYLFRLRRKR